MPLMLPRGKDMTLATKPSHDGPAIRLLELKLRQIRREGKRCPRCGGWLYAEINRFEVGIKCINCSYLDAEVGFTRKARFVLKDTR